MYNFIDTNEASSVNILPLEALQINGEYIENLISGYRTLYVSGREALSPEIETFETGARHGSQIKNRRYPARTIIVGYQLIAKTAEEFREAFNQLAGILNVENARLIFNDEQDKFFTGTPAAVGEVPPGRNAITGEFEIICADPFKYSVIEYEAETMLDETSILLDYGGTFPAMPILQAEFASEDESGADGETETALTGAGDCGFVAFFTEDEKIIQLGDPDEEDGESGAFAKSQTLINQAFTSSTGWGSAAKKLWSVTAGNVGIGTAQTEVAASAANTSGTILKDKASTANVPTFYYTLTAKATNRTATSVKVNIAITTRLKSSSSYFGRGYGLKGHVYIGGAWHSVTIKNTSAYWRGSSGHTVNLTVTLSGLSATDTAISGIKFKTTRIDSLGTAGLLSETACSNLKISTYASSVPAGYYLTASEYNAEIRRNIPADAAGAVGAKNLTLIFGSKMCIGNSENATKQLGAFEVKLIDANGVNVAGARIVKSAAGKTANIQFFINGVKVATSSIDLSYKNKYFGAADSSVCSSKITKTGDKVVFNLGGFSKTLVSDDVAAAVVTGIVFRFERFAGGNPLEYNGLYSVKLTKNNCETTRDIPNKFSAGDIVTADCSTGQIYLNGIAAPELGALGNDWEGFELTPGLNQIGIAYSTWVENAPIFKIRYREVFI